MLRKLGLALLVLIALLTLVFVAGPRVDVTHHPREISLPSDLDAYLRAQEARFPEIEPGAEKTIVWARPDKSRTPIALVYLHGFSATRQETAPLSDQIAARLGANLFYTRLTGHGLNGEALARATVSDWLNDATEALQIGRQIGEKVLVIGCSTGATLATWLACSTDNRDVAGYVLLSANFGPKDPAARFLTWPWAEQWVPRLAGEQSTVQPVNEGHRRYWTTTYPTAALIPMMGLCTLVRSLPLEQIQTPVLMIYSPGDQVVEPQEIEKAFQRWGAANKERVPLSLENGRETHLLAGDIRAPRGTPVLAEHILRFAAQLQVTPLHR